jgi:hypothetical protein
MNRGDRGLLVVLGRSKKHSADIMPAPKMIISPRDLQDMQDLKGQRSTLSIPLKKESTTSQRTQYHVPVHGP